MSNIQPYIILNGTDSRSITGLLISALAPISKPLQRTLVDTVDGRDGDLVTPLGFSAYDKPISIALTYGYDIDDIIEYFNSEGVVTFSNEPDKYYRYAIYEQIDFERLIRFKTAEVTLHCQPFKFSTTETPKLFNVTSGSPITVKNDGNYQSRPNLTIIGSGDVDLSLNGSQVLSLDLEDNQAIIIDTEDMNAYAAQTAIKEVIAEINPVQDLHGQEYPYPAGGGKNKLPFTSGKTWTENGITFLVNEDGSTNVSSNGASTGGSFFNYYTFKLPVGTYYLYALDNDTVWSYSASGKFRLYIGYDGDGYNFGTSFTVTDASKDVVVYIQAFANKTFNDTIKLMISEGSTSPTSYAPYENICPITGFTAANVTRTGKNLFDKTAISNNKWLSTTTGLEENASGYCVSDYIPVKNGQTVFIPTSGTSRRWFYDTNKNPVTYLNNSGNQAYTPVASGYIRVSIQITGSTPVNLDTYQIEYGSTATAYEPYYGEVYNIPFVDDQGDPLKVYGGSLNVTTGVLSITSVFTKIKDLSWTYQSNYTRFYSASLRGAVKTPPSASTIVDGFICECYNRHTYNSTNNGDIYIDGNGNIFIKDFKYTDTTDWLTAIGDYIIVYPLITPQTVQLTPTQINNLLGLNQLYTDTNGDITVTFSSDGVIRTETGDIVAFNCGAEDMTKGILLNRLITGNYDKIRLSKGDNTIVLTGGAQQFVIDKYSRWL